MRKIFLNISLFLLGIVLSVVFFYQGRLDSFISKLVVGTKVNAVESTNSKSVNTAGTSFHPLIPRDLSSEETASLLANSLKIGTLDSLQTLRLEFLKRIPNYDSQVRASVEEAALKNLIYRFDDIDWIDWPSSSFGRNGNPTRARAYVDDITAVNKSLGSSLETAAQVFHDLYIYTARGQVYNLDRGLVELRSNAEQLLQYRKAVAVPARDRFDFKLATNQTFIRIFESIRAKLIAAYINRYTDDIEVQLGLINSLQPEYADEVVYDAVSLLIYRLALQTSVKFRDSIFISYSDLFEDLAQADPRLQRAIGELFLVRATDLLEEGDKIQAEEYYEKAILYNDSPGLRRLLARHLATSEVEPSSAKHSLSSAGDGKLGLFNRKDRSAVEEKQKAASSSAPSEFSFFFIFVVLVMAVGLGFGLIYFYRVRIGSRSYKQDIEALEPVTAEDLLPGSRHNKFRNIEDANSTDSVRDLPSENLSEKEKGVVTTLSPIRKAVNSRT